MNYFAEVNAKLANTKGWRKQALCSLDPEMAPWFTADIVPVERRRQMRAMCEECPVRAECARDANSPRATAGFWAGRSYNQWGGTRD